MNEYCSICTQAVMKSFHYILKFEELEAEEGEILSHCHWKGNEEKSLKLNVNHPDDIPGDMLTKLYFSILSKTQIINLYNVYELDFLLFNYTFKIGDLTLPPANLNIKQII